MQFRNKNTCIKINTNYNINQNYTFDYFIKKYLNK